MEKQFAPRVPPAQQLPSAPNSGVLQTQGVNRNPGQVGARFPQQGQFLGNNLQGAAPLLPQNMVDEFGANMQRANQVIAGENARLAALNGSNMDGSGTDQLFGSGPGFIPASIGACSYGTAINLEEGILTGQARYLQGAGDYNRNSAEAMKTLEQARTLNLLNSRTALQNYYDAKDLNAKYRASRAPLPVSKEKLDRWNQEDQPERLTCADYNSDTGRVQWPSVLTASVFDAYRMELDAVFARRTATEFGPKSDFYRVVHQDTSAMRNILKAYLQSDERFFTDEEYIVAKNFLDSLAHEARLAPDLDGLAAN